MPDTTSSSTQDQPGESGTEAPRQDHAAELADARQDETGEQEAERTEIRSAEPSLEEPPQKQEPSESSEDSGSGLAQSLPIVLGVIGLLIYFVWLCLEMSQQAQGGGALPIAIFGAAVVGCVGAGLAFIPSGRRKRRD